MCTVLTDAPLQTILHAPLNSQCENCNICTDICPTNAIKGNIWNFSISREELVDVHRCISCIKCMVFCPYTQNYIQNSI